MNGPGSIDLIRGIGALRPGAAAAGPGAAEGADFAELLSRAREGTLETGLPVSIADGAGLELTGGQLDRLAGVIDRAHAAGASRIVVMMDGVALDVDVLSRRVLGRAELEGGRVLTGIDGLVRLEGTTAEQAGALPPPSGAISPSLRRALETSESAA